MRTTAAPVFLSPACRVGATPVEVGDLAQGDYLVVLRAPGREELRCAFRVRDRSELSLAMAPEGATLAESNADTGKTE